MAQTISGTPDSIDTAKAQARRLRTALNASSTGHPIYTSVSNCQALEIMARMHGSQSWGALKADLQGQVPRQGTPVSLQSLAEKLGASCAGIIAIEAAPGCGKSTLAAQIARVSAGRTVQLDGHLMSETGIAHFDWTGVSVLHIDEINSFDPAELEARLPKLIEGARSRNVTVILTAQDLGPVAHLLPQGTTFYSLGVPRRAQFKSGNRA